MPCDARQEAALGVKGARKQVLLPPLSNYAKDPPTATGDVAMKWMGMDSQRSDASLTFPMVSVTCLSFVSERVSLNNSEREFAPVSVARKSKSIFGAQE